MRKFLAAVVAALSLAAITFVGGAPAQIGTPGSIAVEGWFDTSCRLSHRAHDDAIVFPGQPGASHLHDFFGNRGLDAHSTNENLLEFYTLCQRLGEADDQRRQRIPADRSGYWVPTAYDRDPSGPSADIPVEASSFSAGYGASSAGARRLPIQPFPRGLRMIAGNSNGGPSRVGKHLVYKWLCSGGTTVTPATVTAAPTCSEKRLELTLEFPDCWDGHNLDSADHKSHMAYSQKPVGSDVFECPSSHPVQVPQLRFLIKYLSHGGPEFRLSSGDISTAHGDFINAWWFDDSRGVDTQAQLVRDCLNVDQYCGGGWEPAPGEGPNPE
jgi:Domain of unknown function (DUF1996)